MKFLLSLLMLFTLTNSCNSTKKAIETKNQIQETLSGTYTISQFEKADVSSNNMTISFDNTSNRVTGFAGCNSFFGSYTIENNMIAFSNLASSKKLCPNEIMKFENQLLKALKSVTSYTIDDNTISFSANDTIIINGIKTVVASKKRKNVNYKDNTTVKYQALSRASFDFISISKSRILISKDRNLRDIDNYNIEAKQWEEIHQLIDAIDAESINELEAPSKQHQYDGAPYATLAIILGDVEYITPAFDHGNPPEAITALVNKVLSIKENTVKQ